MISVISINSSNNTTINAKPLATSVVRIPLTQREDLVPTATDAQTNEVNNVFNARNIIKVQNYCNQTVPVINQDEHKEHNKASDAGSGHDSVLAQSISHDEFDVDEGFNEDSSSSIASGNASIALRGSPTSPATPPGTASATPSAAPSPDFDDYQQKVALMTISGPNGSVRGKRNTVRSRIQNYKELIKLAVSHLVCILMYFYN